jgi:CHAT domain-containing protein/tetratricopeptide (TPR) repeat protein
MRELSSGALSAAIEPLLAEGRLTEAEEAALEILGRAEEGGETAINASLHLLSIRHTRADLEGALEVGDRLLSWDLLGLLPELQLRALEQVGKVHLELGQFKDAMRFFNAALHLAIKQKLTSWKGKLLGAIAEVYVEIGEYAKAELINDSSGEALRESIEEELSQSPIGKSLGAATAKLNKRLRLEYDMVQVLRRRGARIAELRRQYNRAIYYLEGISQYHHPQRSRSTEGQEPAVEDQLAAVDPAVLVDLGRLYARVKYEDDARFVLERALAGARQLKKPTVELLAEHQLGHMSLEAGNPANALEQFSRAVILAERSVFALRMERHRSALWASYDSIFSDAVVAAVSANEISATFELLERGRARATLGALRNHDTLVAASPRLGNVASRYAEARRAWKDEVANHAKAERESNSVLLTNLGGSIERLQRERDRLAEEIRSLSPLDATLTDIEVTKLKDLYDSLDSGTCFIEFFVGDNAVFGVFVTNSGASVTNSSIKRESLRDDIARYRRLLDAESGVVELHSGSTPPMRPEEVVRERARMSDQFYALLFGTYFRNNKVPARLVISAHDVLHELPFATLGSTYPLGQQIEVLVTPSASIFLAMLERGSHCSVSDKVSVLTDPQSSDPEWALPYARDEAESIRAVFPQATIFPGEEATVETFIREISTCAILHVACHAEFNHDVPLMSRLRLADGTITVADVYKLTIPSSVVVLSACQTGASEYSRSGELVGLVQSLLVAGADAVVATHWPIADAATSVLMKAFYGHLVAGDQVALALRKAQSEMCHPVASEKPRWTRKWGASSDFPDYGAPYFWGAFAAYGVPRTTRQSIGLLNEL